MSERIVIGGASGFVGQHLSAAFRSRGAIVQTIGRGNADAHWDDHDGIRRLVDGAALLIGLAGKSVDCRYTPKNRVELMRSRVDTTRALSDAVASVATPPPVWMNASTATIYRHAEDRPQTESSGELGDGFSVSVAKAWEAELFREELPGSRRVALRMAIVLGRGSALSPLLRLVRLGAGGPQLDGPWWGSRDRRAAGAFHEHRRTRGHQRFSWIHIDDVLGAVDFLRDHPVEGPVNLAAPNPVEGIELMRTLRDVVGMPIGVPMPRPLLELGTLILRTETELVLKSRWVLPERLLRGGYRFAFPELEPAVRDIVRRRAAA